MSELNVHVVTLPSYELVAEVNEWSTIESAPRVYLLNKLSHGCQAASHPMLTSRGIKAWLYPRRDAIFLPL